MKTLTPAERLIVSADFRPDLSLRQGKAWVRLQVLALANSLKGTGVYIKVNSALRAYGYDLIDEIHDLGLKVFADLKLNDIGETLATDALLLRQFGPDLVTVMCSTGKSAMEALKAEMPHTEVLGVTVLTNLTEGDILSIFARRRIESVAIDLALVGESAGIDGFICSPKEIRSIRAMLEEPDKFSINTPGIRPHWAVVQDDDQNQSRIMTPEKAIRAGADRIVVGRPIVRAENPYEAVMRTIEEIEAAVRISSSENQDRIGIVR